MPDKTYPVGTLVLAVFGLGRITKVGRHVRSDGAWIASATNDPGTGGFYGHPSFADWWHVKAAVIGETVCPEPFGTHFCGLHHVSPADLSALRAAGAVKS